jgi:hypothetical protein
VHCVTTAYAAASYGRQAMATEAGQATVEWVGLLLTALVLAAAAAGLRATAHDARLGDAVAKRITCAARDACGLDGAVASRASPSRVRGHAPARGGAAARPGLPATGGAAAPSAARAADAFRRLRGAAWIARRAWILCLGYRRWRYELEHPRLPTEPMPLDEALQIANACLNPLSFLGQE